MTNVDTFVKRLSQSDNSLFRDAASILEKYGGMEKTKKSLELFLWHNVAIVKAGGRRALVTSNVPFLLQLEANRNAASRGKVSRTPRSTDFRRMVTVDNPDLLVTWDTIGNKRFFVNMRKPWEIEFPMVVSIYSNTTAARAELFSQILEKANNVRK